MILIKDNLQIEPYGTINYGDVKTISGKLVTGNGTGLGGYRIEIWNDELDPDHEGSPAAYAYTASDGLFTVQALFGDAATWGPYVVRDEKVALYDTLTVEPVNLNPSVTEGLLGSVVEQDVKITATYDDGTPARGFLLWATLPDGSEEEEPARDGGIFDEDGIEDGIITLYDCELMPGDYVF